MSIAAERDCNFIELHARRIWSSVYYYRMYRKFHPDHPFFTPKAVQVLEKYLKSNMKVFEWGSGASTSWFAKRVGSIISIEHNKEWFDKGSIELSQYDDGKYKLLYCPDNDSGETFDWTNQWKYYSILGHAPRKPRFKEYFHRIDDFPNDSFDVVSVDGRERVCCTIHAIPKVKPGGLLILDDSQRPKYSEIRKIIPHDWIATEYDCGLEQTTIFRRP